MKPGRELDQLVAEKVMGWETSCKCTGNTFLMARVDKDVCAHCGEDVPPYYSKYISDAWEITKKICNTWIIRWDDSSALWCVSCDHRRVVAEDCRFGGAEHEAPHAICLAALKAVGVDL